MLCPLNKVYVTLKILLIVEEIFVVAGCKSWLHPVASATTLNTYFLLQCLALTLSNFLFAARSPVFSHTTSSLKGIWTIRSYHKQDQFNAEFCKHQDLHSEAWFMFLATSRWFGFRLDLIMIIFTIGITIGAVPLADCKYRDHALSRTYFYGKKKSIIGVVRI